MIIKIRVIGLRANRFHVCQFFFIDRFSSYDSFFEWSFKMNKMAGHIHYDKLLPLALNKNKGSLNVLTIRLPITLAFFVLLIICAFMVLVRRRG